MNLDITECKPSPSLHGEGTVITSQARKVRVFL